MSKSIIEGMISDFQQMYPRPGLSTLSLYWYDIKNDWPRSWPSGNLSGVYVFLDSDENLLYIGKASSGRRLSTRLRGYFKNNQGVCSIKGKAKETCYVGLIPLPLGHGFEAPAIEEYLITFCSENSDKYPKLRNKVIVAKQARRKFNKQIKTWVNEQLAAFEKDPNSVPENVRSIIVNWKKQSGNKK